MGAGTDTALVIKQLSGSPAAAAVDTAIRRMRMAILRVSGALGTNTDDAAANTATAEQQLFWTSIPITITAFVYIPNGTITADANNNAVITLSKRTAAGGSQTTLATITTNVALGNLVAGQAAVATLTATSTDLPVAAGSSIAVTNAKGGTGVVLRAGTYVVEYLVD